MHTVVIDPGHGGAPTTEKDDRWDPVTGGFLSPYNTGMTHGDLTESGVVLDLALRLREMLSLTRTEEGWRRFRALVRRVAPGAKPERVVFRAHLTRRTGWKPGQKKNNAPYRLYDYPDPDRPGRFLPGRLSLINSHRPELVVSLHMTPAFGRHPGGMAAVLSPGFETYETFLKGGSLGRRHPFYGSPWHERWVVRRPGKNGIQAAARSALSYFIGRRPEPLKDADEISGYRHNMLTWRYADPPGWPALVRLAAPGPYAPDLATFKPEGRFWDRERGAPESWRREGGPLGFGGDNHYAADELLRFVRHAVPRLADPSFEPGPLQPPYAGNYTLPIHTNAVCAYLEIGYLNRKRDRKLVIRHREETAAALAVGVYSLFRGLEIPEGEDTPRGKPVDWDRYRSLPSGNYFASVAP